MKEPEFVPPVRYCPNRGCRRKMTPVKRGGRWDYFCPNAANHGRFERRRRR